MAARQVETANVKPIHSLTPHKKAIVDLHFPEGNDFVVFSLSLDNNVKAIDLVSGEVIAEIVLEDVPSCFCTDFLGMSLFVGFHDGKIRRYCTTPNAAEMSLELDHQAKGTVTTGIERVEEKVLLEVRHKSRVTALAYIPETKEIISSGTDDMLFMFTPGGVPTYTTGKFKKSFDFFMLVPRPVSYFTTTHFGSTAIKAKMHVKPFGKTTNDNPQADMKPRVFVPSVQGSGQNVDEQSLLQSKQMERLSQTLLDSLVDCSRGGEGQHTGVLPRVPTLKKREIEELEGEVIELQGRLKRMVDVNERLMRRVQLHASSN